MDRAERQAIEHDCTKLINRFYHLFNQDLAFVVDLFTKDGTLALGKWVLGPGHDEMRERLHKGSKNMLAGVEVVLNTVSNIVVDVIDDTTAKAISHDTFWEWGYYDGDLQGRPAPIKSTIGINTWEDELRLEDGEWKFHHRHMQAVFSNKAWKLQRIRK